MTRCLLLLALACPLSAAEPLVDADGMSLPEGCLARLGSTRFRVWLALDGPYYTPNEELLFVEYAKAKTLFRYMNPVTGLFVRKQEILDGKLVGNSSVQHILGVDLAGRNYVVLATEAGTGNTSVVTWDIRKEKVISRTVIDVKSGIPNFCLNSRWFGKFDRDTGDVAICDSITGKITNICRRDPSERPDIYPGPDGRTVILQNDQYILLLEASTGKLLSEITRSLPNESLSGVKIVYSGDGSTVVSRTSKGSWITETVPGTTKQLKLNDDQNCVTAFSPDGKQMRVLSGVSKRVETQFVNVSQPDQPLYKSPSLESYSYNATGTRIALQINNTIQIYETSTFQPTTQRIDSAVTELQFYNRGAVLAGFAPDKVSVWDSKTGRKRNQFNPPENWVGLPFPDGRRVQILNPNSAPRAITNPFQQQVTPGGDAIADLLTGRREHQNWSHLANAKCWKVTPCGRYIVVVLTNDWRTRVQKYSLSTGEIVAELHDIPIMSVQDLTISADGNRVALCEQIVRTPLGGPGMMVDTTPKFKVIACDLLSKKTLLEREYRSEGNELELGLTADGSRLWVMTPGKHNNFFDIKSEVDFRSIGPVIDLNTGISDDNAPGDISFRTKAFSANGRALALGDGKGKVAILEAATGGLRTTFQHQDAIQAMAFSPDGTKLAAASSDAPVYVWDVCGTLLSYPKSFNLSTGEQLWKALGSSDTEAAYVAMQQLAAAPQDTLKLFARMQPPTVQPSHEWINSRIRKLDDRTYAVRERSTMELEATAELIESQLRDELRQSHHPEVQRRIQRSLFASGSLSPERIRILRSIEVLEWLATPEAKNLLKTWADGANKAPLTVAARFALKVAAQP